VRPSLQLVGGLVLALAADGVGIQPTQPDDCTIPAVRWRARFEPRGLTGRFQAGDDLLYLASCGAAGPGSVTDTVAVSPAPWSAIEYMLRVGPDSFVVFDRPQRTIVFERDAGGSVTGIRTTGVGMQSPMRRVTEPGVLPIERLLYDTTSDSIVAVFGSDAQATRAEALTETVFSQYPTRRAFVADLVARLVARRPTDTSLVRQSVEMWAQIGDTAAAGRTLRGGEAMAPSDTGLQRESIWLDGGRALPDTGWRVPYPPEQILAAPDTGEVAAAWRTIASRRRSARGVEVLSRMHRSVNGAQYRVLIVAHDVDGHRHVGAVYVPEAPLPSCCATILDIKGTNPGYSPLTLDRGPAALRMLGGSARAYIVVVPAIRGEVLRLAGHEWRAGGDRTDGWDGGAEDALGLLAAAAALEPRIDRSRACVFGRSRGGDVALLVAERDERLRCAVAISPPVEWFDAMWEGGWPKTTVLRVALRSHANPFDAGGQFVEWIMAPIAAGRWTLGDARQRMIAMSPLYFARRLPPTLVIAGWEDTSVPARNAVLLDSAFRSGPGRSRDRSVVMAAMAGHDTDPIIAGRLIREFLARQLAAPMGTPMPGGDAR
jgi:hypothetical protein